MEVGINMTFLIFIIYIIVSSFVFNVLDEKYKLVVKFQDKKDRGFRRIINFISVVSFISLIILFVFEKHLKSLNIDIDYIKIIFVFPLFLRTYITDRIWQINKIVKEDSKKKYVEVTFCYYCGSELNGNAICPSCGKEMEL